MVNRKATKKSRSEVMKDYRKKNKAKIIEYEKLRNERRKLERLKKKVEKYGQPSTSKGPSLELDYHVSESVQEDDSNSSDVSDSSTPQKDKSKRKKSRQDAVNLATVDGRGGFKSFNQVSQRPNFVGKGTTKSRQAIVGEKIRRNNLVGLKNTLDDQANEIKTLKKRISDMNTQNTIYDDRISLLECKLQAKDEDITRLKSKLIAADDWLKIVYFDMSPPERKVFKLAVFHNKDKFPEGTLSRLRRSVGVNFSKPPAETQLKIPPVADKIRDFANLNSSEMPDKKSHQITSVKPDLRFAIHHLTVLHDQYQIDNPDDNVSYRTFCRWWPSNIIKPDLNSRTTCHCRPCENASMKLDALIRGNLLPKSSNVFLALKMEREGDSEMLNVLLDELAAAEDSERKNELITYSVWEDIEKEIGEDESTFRAEKGLKSRKKKVPEKRTKSIQIKKLTQKSREDFSQLKEHLHRNSVIKKFIGEKKKQVLEDNSMTSALLHVDWSENLTIVPVREIQSAFFERKSFSLHSGYAYLRNRSFGFGALGEGCDHRAEAIIAALNPVLEKLLHEGVKNFVFVSDSPVSQYR